MPRINTANCASSKAHLTAKLGFNLLGKQDIRQQLNSAYRMSIEKHNEEVKNNRYVLSKIINCVKFCGAFELALRGHDEGKHSLNPGVFKGLINFSAELDLALREHLQQATVFKGTSKDIQNDLLSCMLCVCQAHIKKEISASKFVSIISDETSDISNTYQMVAVFLQVESILNSRSLSLLSNDPNDLSPLTHLHFLIGKINRSLPDEDATSLKINRLSMYQHIQQIKQHT
ncbi:hypothetical protein RN001_011904 [Aquatica leii]|uniref:DUF4371 domain-containing protein n=1 Tax=Aquatica leii TaxID=1421715 RepID=A0AAN7PTK5_9COLE|nr:hypothetical protein RN001_011904 [Aquatica leii]